MKHTWRACRWAGTASSIEGRLGQVEAVGRFAVQGGRPHQALTDAEAPRQAHVREVANAVLEAAKCGGAPSPGPVSQKHPGPRGRR